MTPSVQKRSFSKQIFLVGLGTDGLKALDRLNKLGKIININNKINYIYLDIASTSSENIDQANSPIFLSKNFQKLSRSDNIVELKGNTPISGKRFESWIHPDFFSPDRSDLNKSDFYTRIMFFLNFKKISGIFENLFEKQISGFVEIIILGSIFDRSTGGIFMDLVATVKKIALDYVSPDKLKIEGVLLLPGPGEQAENKMARTYTALAEISHLSFSDEKFSVQYSNNPGSLISVNKPFFHELILIEPKELDFNKTEILANYIFYQYLADDTILANILKTEIDQEYRSLVGIQVKSENGESAQYSSFKIISNDDLRLLPSLTQYKSAFRKKFDGGKNIFRADVERYILSPLTSILDIKTPTNIQSLSKIEFGKNSFQIIDIPLEQLSVDVIVWPCDSQVLPTEPVNDDLKRIASLAGDDTLQKIMLHPSIKKRGIIDKIFWIDGGGLTAANILFMPIKENENKFNDRKIISDFSLILKKCEEKKWRSIAFPWFGPDPSLDESDKFVQELYAEIRKNLRSCEIPQHIMFSSNQIKEIVPFIGCVERDKSQQEFLLKNEKNKNKLLDGNIIQEYPFPIAEAYSEYIYSKNWKENEIEVLGYLFEQTLKYLLWIAFSEYLAGNPLKIYLDLNDFNKPMTGGTVKSNLYKVVDELDKHVDRNEIVVRELLELSKYKKQIEEVIYNRNGVIHRKKSPKDFEDSLKKLIYSLEWLRNYIMISPKEPTKGIGEHKYNCLDLTGFSSAFRKTIVKCDLDLKMNSVLLVNKNSQKALNLSPFFTVADCESPIADKKECKECGIAQCEQRHLFMFRNSDSKGIDYIYNSHHAYKDKSVDFVSEINNIISESGTIKRTANYILLEES